MSTQKQTASAPLAGYETTYILRSELGDDGVKNLQDRLNAAIAEFGGELVLSEDWGRKKLAYPIQKEARGHYIYWVYTGKQDVVHEIERNLRLNEHVLRYLTVNLEKEFSPEGFKKSRADYHAAVKRREEEREARREERGDRRHGGMSMDDDHEGMGGRGD